MGVVRVSSWVFMSVHSYGWLRKWSKTRNRFQGRLSRRRHKFGSVRVGPLRALVSAIQLLGDGLVHRPRSTESSKVYGFRSYGVKFEGNRSGCQPSRKTVTLIQSQPEWRDVFRPGTYPLSGIYFANVLFGGRVDCLRWCTARTPNVSLARLRDGQSGGAAER